MIMLIVRKFITSIKQELVGFEICMITHIDGNVVQISHHVIYTFPVRIQVKFNSNFVCISRASTFSGDVLTITPSLISMVRLVLTMEDAQTT